MKKWMKKTVAVFLTVAVTITMCVPTFASEIGNTASLMSLSSKEKALCENVLTSLKTDIPNESRIEYYKDILALENKGFTTNEMVVLDTDIRQVAQLIEDLDMNSNEIENLKNGFLTSRPTDPEILLENSHFLSYDEVGIVEPLVENTSSRATAFKEIQISLFTDPKLNKFYEQTGFVHLGNAYATSKIYDNELKYTRPYVILGGHGTTGSIDTGLVWYQEHNKWMLFMNGTCGWKLGSSFYSNGNDMTKTIGTANGSDAYLDMKCSANTVHIIWRNPDTWTIMDEQAVDMGEGFNTTSEIELVRENTLAQGVAGSYLKNVTWRTHYLYSTTKTAKAEKGFFKSSRNGFTRYSGNYLKAGSGTGSATNLNYHGETMNLSI